MSALRNRPHGPLIDSQPPEGAVFWLGGLPVTRAQFAASVAALAAELPEARYAINACENRFAFACAFAAVAARGQTNLLLPPGNAAALADLRRDYPSSYVLGDAGSGSACEVPRMPRGGEALFPKIAPTQLAAIVFTSGSTGAPQAHLKRWASVIHSGEIIARRLLEEFGSTNLLATVPHQHMYGLETCLAVPLAAAHAVSSERPAFPDDVRRALARLPAPRVLVTTPVHIRALLGAEAPLPALAALVSATAPLPAELALRAEQRFGAPVVEIFGSSETGSLASRRTVEGPRWRLLDGVVLTCIGEAAEMRVKELEAPVRLQDRLEPDGADGFRLLGRDTDLVKVGGKRASLADLTLKLASISGVVDAVVFQPQAGDGAAVLHRPAALVVAPDLSENEILAALGKLIDPVFLPRPLRKVAELPRNTVGKLPQAALLKLLDDA